MTPKRGLDRWMAKAPHGRSKPEDRDGSTKEVLREIGTCVNEIKELFNCVICAESFNEPTETQCGHVFCKKCLEELCVQKNSNKKETRCPLCKQPLTLRALVERRDVTDMARIASKMLDYFQIERAKCSDENQGTNSNKGGDKKENHVSRRRKHSSGKKTVETNDANVEVVNLTNTPVKQATKTKQTSSSSSKVTTRDDDVNVARRQQYIIVQTSDVAVTTKNGKELPLDLSVERPKNYKYVAMKPAIRYITALDLSNKRKAEEIINKECIVASNADEVLPPARKKSKFFKTKDTVSNDFEACTRSGSPKPPEDTAQPDSVFTPTPPSDSAFTNEAGATGNAQDFAFTPPPPPRQTQTASRSKGTQGKHTASGKAGTSFTQYMDVASSEIMRDFDQPFDEEEEQIHGKAGKWSGAETKTASDELLENLPDEVLSKTKGTSQQKSKAVSKEKDNFVFKPPTTTITQVPKKKADTKRKEDIIMDWDDEFMQPRDSDLLFLNVSTGSGGGSDCEKENSNVSSRRSDKNVSPVKTPVRTRTQDNTRSGEMNQSSKHVNSGKVDDSEDDDFLLDIPDPNDTPLSGKTGDKEPSTATLLEATIKPVSKQKYVFCPTRLGKEQTQKLQQLCKMCDGTIKRDFDQDVTHLVINLVNGRVPQTLKYLLAIAGRKWVVIYSWVEKCVKEGRVISEAEYETSNFEQCDPGVKRSRLSQKNLFDTYNFYFSTEVYKTLGFTKKDVLMLMDLLGATIVTSADSKYRDLIIIGNFNGNSTEYNDWLFTNKWVTVTFDWVIECILEYRLKPFETKHLCVDASRVKSVNGPKAFKDAVSTFVTQQSQLMSP